MSKTFEEIKALEEELLFRTYNRYPLAIDHGKMSRLYDVNGKEYVDLLAGIAVAGLGHCHEELCKVLYEQSHKFWHVSNLFYQEEQLELASLLLKTTHHEKVFFCNSGAEANEAAIKLARRYSQKIKQNTGYEIITLEGCFHGRTLATLAATGRDELSDGFTPLPDGFLQVPVLDLNALENAITNHTCAVLLEVVQGEAGVFSLPKDYLLGVEKICRDHNILLICDEVQAGFCRTGRFWAFQIPGLKPDIMTSAKSLANGLPMGCMMATNEVAKGFVVGSHATTFGGGALASAVASKVVSIMLRDHLAERAAKLGVHLKNSLLTLKLKYPKKIKDVRGLGLMIGIELFENCPLVWQQLLERGFITSLCHGMTLRLLPALTIEEEDLQLFAKTLDEILATM